MNLGAAERKKAGDRRDYDPEAQEQERRASQWAADMFAEWWPIVERVEKAVQDAVKKAMEAK
jgi:hypothetical protein